MEVNNYDYCVDLRFNSKSKSLEFPPIRWNIAKPISSILMYRTGLCTNIIDFYKGYKKPSCAFTEHLMPDCS